MKDSLKYSPNMITVSVSFSVFFINDCRFIINNEKHWLLPDDNDDDDDA